MDAPMHMRLVRAREADGGPRLRSDAAFARVRCGVYAPRAPYTALPPWERYAARVRAFTSRVPGAILSHESAAAMLGLPLIGEPRDLHVYDPGRDRSRRYSDVHAHASVDPRDVVTVGDVLCTSVVDTLIDLARTRPPAFALAAWDHALRYLPDHVQLDWLADRWRGQQARRQTKVLCWLETAASALAESVAESVSRASAEWLGFERPQLQYEVIAAGSRYRGDMFFPTRRVLGEVDGVGKYLDETGTASLAAFQAEKRREERLRALGFRIARWGWAEAVDPDALERMLLGAGVPRTSDPRPQLLATLRTTRRA